MRLIKFIIALALLSTPLWATNYTVKAGGGGNYTTIQACATAMAAGDTCTVYAGTYTESPSIPAGTSGNYKTITVNGSDVVNVTGTFTLNSHTKLIGNCTEPAASASCGFSVSTASQSGGCVATTDGSTDFYITNNVFFQCGLGNDVEISFQGTNGVSFVYIQGNTFSYGCGTAAAPNNCVALGLAGNHILVQNNDFSHFGIVIEMYGQYEVARNNTFHDILESECGSASGNCHMDMLYAERSNTAASDLVQYHLWEGNTATNIVGVDGKGLWTAADDPGGCGTSCFNVIGRLNVFSHFGSATAAQTSGFLNVKYYNNTWVDPNNSVNCGPASTDYRDSGTGGAEINNLFYYPKSIAQTCGQYAYPVPSGAQTGFTAGANLLYCNGTPCGLQTQRGGTSFLFISDTPVIATNILDATDPLVNYSAGNFNLAAGSAALNAGTYLTTVAAGDSGSGTSLVVTDAGFFQDGLGLTAAGVQADCISITTVGNHVCITAVNYSTNTLTMASGFSRSNGDHIWLYSNSSGTVVLTGSAPNIGALGTGSATPSFTCSPSTVPANHSGNIALSCSASGGLTWSGATVFTVGSPATLVSYSNTSSTAETVTITTGAGTGSSTITDTTDSVSTNVSVATETFAIAPTSGAPGSGGCSTACQGTITFSGTNSIWSLSAPTFTVGTFSGTCTGDSIGSPTVTSNTIASAVLTWGSAPCVEVITDTTTGATANFTVNPVTSITHVTGACSSGAASTSGSNSWTFSCTPYAANDAIVFNLFCNPSTGTITSATLAASGWTFTTLVGVLNSGGAGAGWGVKFGAIAPNTSSTTFTVTFAGVANCSGFSAYMNNEYNGNNTGGGATTFPVQASLGAASGGCNQTGANITPTTSNNAVDMACFDAPLNATSPWLPGSADGTGGDLTEYQILSGGSGTPLTPAFGGTTGAYIVMGTTIATPSGVAISLPAPALGMFAWDWDEDVYEFGR